MSNRGAVAGFRPWSSEEKAVVRERYIRAGAAELATQLGRTKVSIQKQAVRLGERRYRRWSPADDDELRDLWGTLTLHRIARRLNRTPATIYWRANQLGLERGATQGHEYLFHAAKRTGFAIATLRRILKAQGVRLVATMSRPTGARRHYHAVDPFDVDEAVKAWLEAEDVAPAAKARGIPGETLAQWLEWAGKFGGLEVPARPGGKQRWRVPSKTIDAALAWRAEHESIAKAAQRHGVSQWALRNWLIDAGVRKWSVKPWFVLKTEVDRIVAERRSLMAPERSLFGIGGEP